jgi:putative ABC transport system permease protein
MQIGLFTVILTLTAAVIVMMVMYNLTLEKTHDLAVLKLMGAPRRASSAWCCSRRGCSGRSATRWPSRIGELLYPDVPARVLITETISLVAPLATMVIVTLASMLGLSHVMRIDPSRALEG